MKKNIFMVCLLLDCDNSYVGMEPGLEPELEKPGFCMDFGTFERKLQLLNRDYCVLSILNGWLFKRILFCVHFMFKQLAKVNLSV